MDSVNPVTVSIDLINHVITINHDNYSDHHDDHAIFIRVNTSHDFINRFRGVWDVDLGHDHSAIDGDFRRPKSTTGQHVHFCTRRQQAGPKYEHFRRQSVGAAFRVDSKCCHFSTARSTSRYYILLTPLKPRSCFNRLSEQEVLLSSLVNPQVFNDERDGIIAKWNQLQAFSGTGKIFYQNSAVDVPKENIFSRFKVQFLKHKPEVKQTI